MRVYGERGPFLEALAARLAAVEGADVAFGKYSPGGLAGPVVEMLHRQVATGGRLLLAARDGAGVRGWLAPLAARFAGVERARVVLLPATVGIEIPALTIDTSDVFLHLTWALPEGVALPYTGLHLSGGDQVRALATALRASLTALADAAGSAL